MKKLNWEVFNNQKVYDLGLMWQGAQVTRLEGETCRHRLEKRWYRRLVFINFAIIIGVIAFLVVHWGEDIAIAGKLIKQFFMIDVPKKDQVDDEDIPTEILLFGYGVGILISFYFALYYTYAMYRANSLRITKNNFPEVYQVIETYSRQLGIETPKAYVMQSNGILNAFSTFIFRKQWICIHSELFEVAYREHKDLDALSFIIAHELSHIYYKHSTLHYNLAALFSINLPVIGAIASRTREYSCDRLAQRLSGTDGIDAMLVLVIDRHLYKMVDREDYLNTMREQKGFFIWLVNLLADHPIMCRRVLALHEGKGSGRLY